MLTTTSFDCCRISPEVRRPVDCRRVPERPLLGRISNRDRQVKQPFRYEELIQDRYVPTMERSMIDQLMPQRDEGVMIHGHKMFDNRFEYGVSVSNGDQNDSTIDDHNHKDLNARIAIRPFNDPDGWDVVRGLGIGVSGTVGVEDEAIGTTTSPSIITTPATVTWFAYNSGVLANGFRDRLSPELVCFYHSFGFASQYFEQHQVLQLSAAKPLVDVPVRGLLRDGDLSPDGRATDRLHAADRAAPSFQPLRADGLPGGLGTGVPRRTA